MAVRPLEAVTRDEKIARFLLSDQVKNKTLRFMWLRIGNTHCAWMLVDGALEGTNDKI